MADKIISAPYEVLLRFGCEVGEKAGQVRGAHVVELGFVVDDANVIKARLNRGPADHAQPITAAEFTTYLGGKMQAVLGQLADATAAIKLRDDKIAAQAEALEAAAKTISTRNAQIATLQAAASASNAASVETLSPARGD